MGLRKFLNRLRRVGEFVRPEIPLDTAVRRDFLRCMDCRNKYQVDFPANEAILPLKDTFSDEARWLPVYGERGYVQLLCELVPGVENGTELKSSR